MINWTDLADETLLAGVSVIVVLAIWYMVATWKRPKAVGAQVKEEEKPLVELPDPHLHRPVSPKNSERMDRATTPQNKRVPSWFIEGALVFGLFLIGLAIRGNDLSSLAAFPDELTYSSRAIHILGANWNWPVNQMWDQPPLFTYILATVIAAGGATLDSLRWVSVVAGSFAILFAYLLGRSMYGRIAGAIASIGVAFNGYHILYSRLLYIEALASMLILASTFFFWEGIMKRRNLKLTIVGGIVYGLALDSKYISMVAGVAFIFFMLVYWNKFRGKFPLKEVAVFYSTSILVFLPVLLDFAAKNVNPFYFDLVGRFQLKNVNTLIVSVKSGQLFITGFTRFAQVFFHVSSTDPFQVFPFLSLDIFVWTALISIVMIFFAISFFLRKNLSDGLLFVLFVGLLAFAFLYPGKRPYFALYPTLVLMVMLGRVVQLAISMISSKRVGLAVVPKLRRVIVPILAVVLISLTIIALAINISAVPLVYKNGFGDYDEIFPIVNYISVNHGNNSYVATDLGEFGYYVEEYHINVSFAYMKQPVEYYTEPPINQSLMIPTSGVYPIYYVLSTTAVEKMQPQFIILTRDDFQSTTTAFQQFINQRYYQPLSTKLVLLFEIRPNNQSAWNYTN